MNPVIIGGHLGLDVIREGTDIRKQAKHRQGISGEWAGVDMFDHNVTALKNEARMLRLMRESGYTPELLFHSGDYHSIHQEDLGNTETPIDPEAWRRNCVRMLAEIRARGLRHGDLIGANIITIGNKPYAIDWQEGHLLTEPAPQRNPSSDSAFLMRHIAGTPGPDGQMDIPRVARRWGVVLGALGANTNLTLPLKGKSFLDLGCFQGDFVALAAAEGMAATGIDEGGFRSGENSIEIGRKVWADFPFGEIRLARANIILDSPKQWSGHDVVMMFSTWPYIVQNIGWERACDLLYQVIKNNEVLFFETQLYGDGPGPEQLKDDGDVDGLLLSLGATTVKNLGSFPVTNRPASRTIWEVRK